MQKTPTKIKVHNLQNINIDIPLLQFVAISELSRWQWRIKLGAQADVTSVKHILSALALNQQPQISSEQATIGTISESFNMIR